MLLKQKKKHSHKTCCIIKLEAVCFPNKPSSLTTCNDIHCKIDTAPTAPYLFVYACDLLWIKLLGDWEKGSSPKAGSTL